MKFLPILDEFCVSNMEIEKDKLSIIAYFIGIVMPHISSRIIYELDILHFISYYILDFARLSNFTYDVMGPRLWSYYVYYGIVIMMVQWLWCHHGYNVAMFLQLQCVDYHRITVFYNDSICWNVSIYQMWSIWCDM